MTSSENERLAVVETNQRTVMADVAEIKTDVKTLMASHYALIATSQSRSQMGIWVRSVIPWVIGVGSMIVTVAGFILRLH